MANSRYDSEQFTSESFVESAGTILFRLWTREICILRYRKSGEYILAKGRRNCGESHQAAAVRETTEETGIPCRLLPVNMHTRAPPADDPSQVPDRARLFTGICEPFCLQIRRATGDDIKLIYWFIGAVTEDRGGDHNVGEEKYAVEFFGYDEVLEKLTFQMDRDMVKKAVEIVTNTYKN